MKWMLLSLHFSLFYSLSFNSLADRLSPVAGNGVDADDSWKKTQEFQSLQHHTTEDKSENVVGNLSQAGFYKIPANFSSESERKSEDDKCFDCPQEHRDQVRNKLRSRSLQARIESTGTEIY